MVEAVKNNNSISTGFSNLFRGLGNVSNAVGDSLIGGSLYLNSMFGNNTPTSWERMYFNGYGCWISPYWSGGFINYGTPTPSINFGCNCGCSSASGSGFSSGSGSYGNSSSSINTGGESVMSHVNAMNAAMDVSGIKTFNVQNPIFPIYNPESAVSAGSAYSILDRVNHPENYNPDGSKKTTAKTDAKDKPIELVDPSTGQSKTPLWYNTIANKKEKGEKLSADESKWYQKFNKIFKTYSPYVLDENLNPKIGADGQPQKGILHSELIQLQAMIEHKDAASIENYLSSCSVEKRAAIELHYNSYDMKAFTKGKNLREAIKDACINTWIPMEWTGYNTDRCQRIFDKMDEAAMESPENMKYALKQALENHRIWGLGFDDSRVCKLLAQMKESTFFRDSVKGSYTGLIPSIEGKWFKSERVTSLLREIFV